MSPFRRSIALAVACAALAVGPAAALAHKTHVAHARKVSGVVLAINAHRHTLKLRVGHAAAARVASAGGSTLTIAFGQADVSGGNGAVEVGDDVTITTTGGGGGNVATAIDVIGAHNGGDAGQGAAIPGTVTAIDVGSGSLTLATGSSSLQVSVTATTVLAIPGATGGVTLASIAVGDHVVVFTDDATASPVVAIGILDGGAPKGGDGGGDGHSGDTSPSTNLVSFGGSVQSVDLTQSQITVAVPKGPLAGDTVLVTVNGTTHLGRPGGDGAQFTLAQVKVGDLVSIATTNLSPTGMIAFSLYDAGPPPSTPPSGGDGGGQGSTSPPSSTMRFAATVSAVGGDGATVTAINGPLIGQSVRVSVTSTTSFSMLTVRTPISGFGADVKVGDTLEVYTQSETTTPIVAVGLIDYGIVTD